MSNGANSDAVQISPSWDNSLSPLNRQVFLIRDGEQSPPRANWYSLLLKKSRFVLPPTASQSSTTGVGAWSGAMAARLESKRVCVATTGRVLAVSRLSISQTLHHDRCRELQFGQRDEFGTQHSALHVARHSTYSLPRFASHSTPCAMSPTARVIPVLLS